MNLKKIITLAIIGFSFLGFLLGFLVGSALGFFLLGLFGRPLLTCPLVVGFVEPGTFEHDSRTTRDLTLSFGPAFGASDESGIADLLQLLVVVSALRTDIMICWHLASTFDLVTSRVANLAEPLQRVNPDCETFPTCRVACH